MTQISNFQISEDMIEQFYREGYFYARGFITPEAVQSINEENQAFANEKSNGEWKSKGIIYLEKEEENLPRTVEFLRSPDVVHIYEQILGDKIKLWMGMYAVVPPHGKGLEWHQDNQYTHILGHMMNGFIALDLISQENAGLWIAPRSHLLGRQPNLNTEEVHKRAAEPENGIPCEQMEPGDAVFFHRETLHHSKQNHTDRPRRAFAFQVAAASCRYATTGKRLEDRDLISATYQ